MLGEPPGELSAQIQKSERRADATSWRKNTSPAMGVVSVRDAERAGDVLIVLCDEFGELLSEDLEVER